MFCAKCGTQLPNDANCCSNCGAAVNAPAQPAYTQQPVYAQPVMPASVPGKGLGVASMVLGIIALVLFCYWPVALICGIVGLSLGAVSMNKAKAVGGSHGMATAGVSCSCIALGLMILFIILVAAGMSELNDLLSDLL